VTYWQPPDWSEPSKEFLPRNQVGSLASHVLAARALAEACAAAGQSHLLQVPYAQPIAFHLWRSGGLVHVLLGNLETGLTGDARTGRQVTLVLNRQHLGLGVGGYSLRSVDRAELAPAESSPLELRFPIDITPEGSDVYVLYPVEHGPDRL
jgi:hypothetical protein